jgi:hypothetical protein
VGLVAQALLGKKPEFHASGCDERNSASEEGEDLTQYHFFIPKTATSPVWGCFRYLLAVQAKGYLRYVSRGSR